MEHGKTTKICGEETYTVQLIICNGAPPGETPHFLRGDEPGRSNGAPRSFTFRTDQSACKVIRFECDERWGDLIEHPKTKLNGPEEEGIIDEQFRQAAAAIFYFDVGSLVTVRSIKGADGTRRQELSDGRGRPFDGVVLPPYQKAKNRMDSLSYYMNNKDSMKNKDLVVLCQFADEKTNASLKDCEETLNHVHRGHLPRIRLCMSDHVVFELPSEENGSIDSENNPFLYLARRLTGLEELKFVDESGVSSSPQTRARFGTAESGLQDAIRVAKENTERLASGSFRFMESAARVSMLANSGHLLIIEAELNTFIDNVNKDKNTLDALEASRAEGTFVARK